MHEPADDLLLWATGREGLADPLDPDSLAASHPMWAAEVERHASWRLDGDWWRSGSGGGSPAPVVVCGPCGSSFDVAHALAAEGALPEWGAVMAVSQRSGRGQLRRPWVSPAGNMYVSWRWPALPPEWSSPFPLVCGWLMAETLAHWGMEVSIKWPNDLLDAYGRKVGGILVEERGSMVLVGIGLNLNSAPQDSEIREEWSPRAAPLSPLSDSISGILLWQGLVNRARNWYDSLTLFDTPRAFLDILSRRLAWAGRRVRVRHAGEEYTAVLAGLSDEGGLVLARRGREEVLYSGSIALE